MAGRNVFARIGVQMDADQARRELESINDGVAKLGNARLDTARTQFEQLGASVGKTASAYQPLTEAQRRAYEQREDDVQQIGRLQRSYATLGGALAAVDVQVQHGHRTAQDAARIQSGLIEAYSKGGAAYAAANDKATASTGQFRGALGNMGLQLQDVIVQAQMGTNAFVILAQQGSQAASAFGPLGAAIGTAIALFGALGAATMSAGGNAEDATTAFNDYAKALEFTAKLQDELARATRGQADAMAAEKRNIIEVRKEALRLAEARLLAARAAADEEEGDGLHTGTGISQSARQSAANRLGARWSDLRNELEILKANAGDYSGVVDRMVQQNQRAETGVTTLGEEIAKARQGIVEQTKALGLEADTFGKSNAEKLRATLTQQMLAKEYKTSADQLSEATKRTINDAVAQQERIDKLEAQKKAQEDATRAGEQAGRHAEQEERKRQQALRTADIYVDRLRGEADGLKLTERERFIANKALEFEHQLRGKLSPEELAEYIRQVEYEAGALYDVTDARKQKTKADEEAVRALEAYQREMQNVAEGIAKDWSETLYDSIVLKDKRASIVDSFRDLFKRIAIEAIKAQIVLPITTSIVGSVPGLFGISSPANQNAANQNGGMGGVGNVLSGASGLNSMFGGPGGLFGSGSSGIGGMFSGITAGIDMFAANNLGIGTVMAGPTTTGAAGYVSGGLTSMLGPMATVAAGGATIGGFGAKMLGGNSTVGSVAGALTGGIPGALIGALFKEPKPSNKEGNVSLDFATGSATVGGQTGSKYSAENRQAAQGIGGQIQQLAATLEALLPGQQIAGRGLVAVGSRDGLRAEYGGQTASFRQQDTAGLAAWFAKQFAGDLKDGFERGDLPEQVAANLRAVLDRGVVSGVEQFVADMQLAATNFTTAFDALGKAQPDQIAGQVTEVATAFVTMRDNAAKLGLSVDGLSASLKGATDRMIDGAIRSANGTGFIDQAMTIRATFEKVGQQLLSTGQDGSKAVQLYGAQMSALVNSFGEDENAVKNLTILADAMRGVDDVAESFARLRIEQVRGTMTAKEQADAAAKLADEQAKATEQMLAQAGSLLDWLNGQKLGDTSSLSPVAKMEEAQRQFDAALSTSRQNGDISGATKAADALLSASKPTLVMGTEAYGQREAWITSTLRNLGHELGLPGFAIGGDHLGGLRIVGERGPELEWTGPSRIFSADQTRQILAGATSQAAPNVTVNVDTDGVVRAVSQSTLVLQSEIRRLSEKVERLEAQLRADGNLNLVAGKKAA